MKNSEILPKNMDIDELAQRCRQETVKYLAGRPHREVYGFELFRRALLGHDQAAWQAIYDQYHVLVADWAQSHSKFPHTGEDAAFFVNDAFARFWRRLIQPELVSGFDSLGQFLRYLKCCVHSTIEDAWRRKQRWPVEALAWDELEETLSSEETMLSKHTSTHNAETLLQLLLDQSNDEEVLVARLSWLYGLPPREIQIRHTKLFPNVQRVYQVKRNLLNRLLRNSEIRQWYEA